MEDFQQAIDTGAQALITIAQFHQIAADISQLRHKYAKPGEVFTDRELLRGAKAMGFKARLLSSSFEELANGALPAIAKTHDGLYFIIARVAGNEQSSDESTAKVLALLPNTQAPQELTPEHLSQHWNGELILMTRRGGMLDIVKEFGISWFIPSLVK